MLDAARKGLTQRQIAELFWGRERVAEEWWPGGWMHGRVRRRLRKARAMLNGYRDIAAGR